MTLNWDQQSDLAILAAAIARSPIVVRQTLGPNVMPAARRHLPEGFDEVDIAILDWIAAEGRRAGRALLRM